jgi:hypothetical protein
MYPGKTEGDSKMRVIGLLIALFIVSCSTEKRATGEVTLANVTGEFNENGSPAISKSEDLSPVVPLLPATADKFVSRGVTLMPPEANGTYLVFCQEANTNQKVNLLDDVKPTRKVPANTPYAAAGYLKVEGNCRISPELSHPISRSLSHPISG